MYNSLDKCLSSICDVISIWSWFSSQLHFNYIVKVIWPFCDVLWSLFFGAVLVLKRQVLYFTTTTRITSSSLKKMVAIPEVLLSSADINIIFGDMNFYLNAMILQAFCSGANACGSNLKPILTWILNRDLYRDHCYYLMDCLFVTFLLKYLQLLIWWHSLCKRLKSSS